MAYAETTTVPVSKTRGEIETMLQRHKCTQFIIGADSEERRAMVQFKAENRLVRFIVSLPDPKDKKFTHARNGWSLNPTSKFQKMIDQAERQRWRALMLVIKAKLEAVESHISTFEEEFLSFIVMADGRTVGEQVIPQIAAAYESGSMKSQLLLVDGRTT